MTENSDSSKENISQDAKPYPAQNTNSEHIENTHEIINDSENSETPIPPQRQKKKNANFEKPNYEEFSIPKNNPAPTIQNVYHIVGTSGVHIGNNMTFHFSKQSSDIKQKKDLDDEVILNESIRQLMLSDEEVHHDYMSLISKNLGEGWRSVFRKLNYEDAEIETFYEDNFPKGVSEVIYQLLLDWVRSGDARTLGKLCTILWNEEKFLLVQKLAKLHDQKA